MSDYAGPTVYSTNTIGPSNLFIKCQVSRCVTVSLRCAVNSAVLNAIFEIMCVPSFVLQDTDYMLHSSHSHSAR